MAIDHYSPCPCGNGKKLKFCNCVDSPQEYEKVMKLIEGGQAVAAVDRINQLLGKTPNAAWLLAIKGELTLGMQEFDSFKETAERFLKLKPDNPLALVMKSIASTMDEEPVQNAARYLLDGMSEARESLPALTLTAIRILVRSLVAANMTSLIGYWSDVLSALSQNSQEGPADDSALLDPTINLLAKAPARIIEDPPGTQWNERLAEVISLAKTFRFAQAETKLRAILRDFPDQPGPLSHLLRAQCAQLDQAGAFASATKLSEHLELSADDRAYFQAVSMELEPDRPRLDAEMVFKYCEVESDELVIQTMQQFDFTESVEGEGSDQIRGFYAAVVQDEVPAKRLFTIFDKPFRTSEAPAERDIASSVGTVVVYGKQTDKPGRVLFLANRFPANQARIEQVLTALDLGQDMPEIEFPLSAGYAEFLRRPRVVVGQANGVVDLQERSQFLVDDLLQLPMNALDGKSPLEASGEERLRGSLLGLLYHLEGEQSILADDSAINQVYEKLGFERPQITVDPESDALQLRTVLDMDRVPAESLNDQQIKGLMVRAMGMGATRVFHRAALSVRSRDGLNDSTQLQVAALSGLLSVEEGIDQRIELCTELETVLVAANAPVGKVVIQKMSLLHAAGRPEEAQQTLMEAAQKYPSDPYLMSFIQYAMQAQGGQMPAGAPGVGGDQLASKMMQNAARPAAPDAGSGLVLPGQAPSSSEDGGDSKLWLPGS